MIKLDSNLFCFLELVMKHIGKTLNLHFSWCCYKTFRCMSIFLLGSNLLRPYKREKQSFYYFIFILQLNKHNSFICKLDRGFVWFLLQSHRLKCMLWNIKIELRLKKGSNSISSHFFHIRNRKIIFFFDHINYKTFWKTVVIYGFIRQFEAWINGQICNSHLTLDQGKSYPKFKVFPHT